MTGFLRHGCVALVLMALALPAVAQGGDVPADALSGAELAQGNLLAAARQLRAAESARDRVSALTGVVHAYEAGLTQVRAGLRQIVAREAALTTRLDAQSEEIAALLGVLQAMGRTPGPVTLLHPSGPIGTARGGMLLADVTPALEVRVSRLRAKLEEIAALRAAQAGLSETLEAGLDGATEARTALSAALSERRDLPRRFEDDPVQAALLVASSESLADLAEMLGDLGSGGDLPLPDTMRGELPPPVAGRVAARFGDQVDGTALNGVRIATVPRALVSVPTQATLRFKGPLLDYGTVAVIEPAADVLMIFAGLSEVFGAAGEVLPAGSPLGLMGGTPASSGEILTVGGGEARPETLYIEVREGGTPVDPAGWFVLE